MTSATVVNPALLSGFGQGEASIAIGADGFPILSYTSQIIGGDYDLKVARCSDLTCTAATFNVVDGGPAKAQQSSIAIGADDRPVVSYLDGTKFDLKVAHCWTLSAVLRHQTSIITPSHRAAWWTRETLHAAWADQRSPQWRIGNSMLPAYMWNRAVRKGHLDQLDSHGLCRSREPADAPSRDAGPIHLVHQLLGWPDSGQQRDSTASADGELAVYCAQASGTVHFILDVNGYFE